MIVTSNLCGSSGKQITAIALARLMKCGWHHMDNSAVLLLRLLDQLGVKKATIAGLDGFTQGENYAEGLMENLHTYDSIYELNVEIQSMLKDFMNEKRTDMEVRLLTESQFSSIINEV